MEIILHKVEDHNTKGGEIMTADHSDDQNRTRNDGEEENRAAMNAPEQQPQTAGASDFLGFTGSYLHSLDAKGRVIIPAPFREALGERFVVALSPDYQAVALYPTTDWIARRDELLEKVKAKPSIQKFLDTFAKYSFTGCEADAQGRLLLPQKIRAWRLGDARDVEINGALNHIRIVPAAAGAEQDRLFDEMYSDPLAAMTALWGD